MLRRLSKEQWLRRVQPEGKKRTEPVYWLARAMALHELEHLVDIQQKLNR